MAHSSKLKVLRPYSLNPDREYDETKHVCIVWDDAKDAYWLREKHTIVNDRCEWCHQKISTIIKRELNNG